MSNKLIVRTEEWSFTCGDGCCYTYGTDVFIDEIKVSDGAYGVVENIVVDVLEHLGYNATTYEGDLDNDESDLPI